MMYKISAYLEQDHRRCDEQYAVAESEVTLRNWDAARRSFATFLDMFECHLDKEERVLFPRLDHALGNGYGATVVMREEHRQIRAMQAQMRRAIEQRDSDAFFEYAGQLRELMRQHSMKEDGILYPQADFVLVKQADAIIAVMENLYHAEAA